MSEKIRLIIDTDPGQDDAAAILMAHGLAKRGLIEFLALTVVAGNVGLHHTANNARIICDWAGEKDFPVYAGATQPLVRKLVTAEEVHGKNGLDGAELHDPVCPLQPVHAVPYLIDTLRKADDSSITICPIGPLTNIAQAITLAPDITRAIKKIVMMGGNYFEAGNITPAAEFNFYVDPHAAQIVMQSGVPIAVLPLDVTHKATITTARMDALRQLGNINGNRLAGILQSYERYDTQKFGLEGGPLHDPCAVAYAVFPEFFNGKDCHVEIETQSELSMGSSVVDWWGTTGKPVNAHWVTEVNANKLFHELAESIKQLP
ncbi:nucleoside hydrolase [Neisseria weaveri]|uniref:nucleoside hydrolase n=1 Tax=Neisseria weaveri TaxID=28091 RepID=UPI0002230A8E|nr:nucleoside hydrolase [Neisseria weaveri]EGV37155.1 inosine-uridine preferring nucleoside hydrolase [Neisseria weaveri ATCC 51223]SAY50969.1 Pyrimidine-specific ribonucleoside hydrolase rihB [Neisseria weaveri]